MYQYSLQYIEKIIHYSMDNAEKSKSVDTRLNLLIDEITKNIYRNVSRGLFEKDKTINKLEEKVDAKDCELIHLRS